MTPVKEERRSVSAESEKGVVESLSWTTNLLTASPLGLNELRAVCAPITAPGRLYPARGHAERLKQVAPEATSGSVDVSERNRRAEK